MRPTSYRQRSGCWNCKKAVEPEGVDFRVLYCTHNANPMPPYSSPILFLEWAEGRMVTETGVCDEHTPSTRCNPPLTGDT
jgi:hypothetical protein